MKFIILKQTLGTRGAQQLQLPDHLSYLHDLANSEVLVAAGNFDDWSGSILFIEARDLDEATAIAQQDPMVQAGVESFQVKGWRHTLGDWKLKERLAAGPISAKPLEVPPSEDSFRVAEATSDPEYAETMLSCFLPEGKDYSLRHDYLSRATPRGLCKLLLLHEKEIAGQIEYAPPGVSGLPVAGPGVTVIHCLWVVDAYTGLDCGRRLLAACAERSRARSLATVAYNATLPWMPRSFFESQGFLVVDRLETGRFFNETPIVASLLWRPLDPEATPPSWDRGLMLEGVDFCPGYPWMFGKRLYWGNELAFQGLVVKEGLRRPEVLHQFPHLGSQRLDKWTLVKLGVPRAGLEHAVQLLQGALISEPTYYAHLHGQDQVIIIFPDRRFDVSSDPASWAAATRYGLDHGIPEEELVFHLDENARS